MPRRNLTTKFVESVKVEKREEFWDDTMRGLTLRVTPTGAESWSIVWTGAEGKKRLTLGGYPEIDLASARQRALSEFARIQEGHDPSQKKREDRSAMTVAQLAEKYIERYAKPRKRSWAEDERILERDFLPVVGSSKRIQAVTRRDILDAIDAKVDAGKPVAARALLAVVRKLFNWAVAEDYLPASPAAGVQPRTKPTSRERVLTDDEIRAVWSKLDTVSLRERTRDVVRLAFILGQRIGEIAGMTRGEVDLAAALWTIPAERAKNGLAHAVPLPESALAIVAAAVERAGDDVAGWLFSTSAHGLTGNGVTHAVADKLQIDDADRWTPHDARRTMATRMIDEIGTEPHVVEAVLNHVSGHRAGIAAVYNRATYLVSKRRALDLWAAHLETILTGSQAKVISLKRIET